MDVIESRLINIGPLKKKNTYRKRRSWLESYMLKAVNATLVIKTVYHKAMDKDTAYEDGQESFKAANLKLFQRINY